MLTPSYVAADILNNGEGVSAQAQLCAITRFATCPLLILVLLTLSSTSLRALSELSSRCF